MGTYSHNVLNVYDQHQRVSGFAKINKLSEVNDFMYAVSDISTVYEDQLKEVNRRVGMIDGNYVVVRDEFETLDKKARIRWNMVTNSSVELGQNDAILTDNGKKLYVKINGPKNIEMKTWSTAPKNNYDDENPGTIMLGFECEIPANTEGEFAVILVPAENLNRAQFLDRKPVDC